MKRIILVGFAIALMALGYGYLNREPILLNLASSKVETVALSDHEAFIAPHIKAYQPEGITPPYPTFVLFHGCAGITWPFLEDWARVATEVGYQALIVDSHAPRGISRDEARETVCKGTQLIGQERAGDILAAYRLISNRSDVDKENIVLSGWSHGAWTIMDFLTMNMKSNRPAQIAEKLDEPPAPDSIVLFYPYCGEGARSRFAKWVNDPPALAFIAGKDSIVSPEQCLDVFTSLRKRGETITHHYYPDADHVFDNAHQPDQWKFYYNEGYAKDSIEKVKAFLLERKNAS